MDRLSELNTYLGKPMPPEFSEICKKPKFKEKILNRKDPEKPVFRFYKYFKNFLRYTYAGDLPKDLCSLAGKFGYSKYLQDLFYLDEDGYKNVYPAEYAYMFENLSESEKDGVFWRSDYGARDVFELEQDVIASNIFEDMLSYHSKNALSANRNSSGRGSSKITTNCDLIYRTPETFKEQIEIPIEIKTKWAKSVRDNEKIDVRGSARNIQESKGMILAIYMNCNTCVLVDTAAENDITKGTMGVTNKECDEIRVNKDSFMKFRFWEKDDMKALLNNIYLTYKKRI